MAKYGSGGVVDDVELIIGVEVDDKSGGVAGSSDVYGQLILSREANAVMFWNSYSPL